MPVSKGGVEGVLKSMQKDKSSGPDGWTVEFYQHFFELLGDDLAGMVEESKIEGLCMSPSIQLFWP